MFESIPKSLRGATEPLQYKPCAGMDCINRGQYPLTVLYVNKVGLFCEECKYWLVKHGLAAETESIDNGIPLKLRERV